MILALILHPLEMQLTRLQQTLVPHPNQLILLHPRVTQLLVPEIARKQVLLMRLQAQDLVAALTLQERMLQKTPQQVVADQKQETAQRIQVETQKVVHHDFMVKRQKITRRL